MNPTVASRDTSVRLWDIKTGRQLARADLPFATLFQAVVTPDGRHALVSGSMPFLVVLETTNLTQVAQLEGHNALVPAVDVSPDGKYAVSASVDGSIILWNLETWQVERRFGGGNLEGLWAVSISPDGRTALSDSNSEFMILWELESGTAVQSFELSDDEGDWGSSGIAFLPDGKSAISGSSGGILRQWDLETGELIRTLGQHADIRTRVEVSPDGELALSSGMDGVLKLWDLESGELVRQFGTLGQTVFDIEMGADGLTAFSGSSDTTIVKWRLQNPSLDELQEWVDSNRVLRNLSCDERELYQIKPLCEAGE